MFNNVQPSKPENVAIEVWYAISCPCIIFARLLLRMWLTSQQPVTLAIRLGPACPESAPNVVPRMRALRAPVAADVARHPAAQQHRRALRTARPRLVRTKYILSQHCFCMPLDGGGGAE
ncbi:hypothetical protein EVG20_g11509 [Dentipellis fragilis]|uniref:Uncharacterized protein n=1 Tax=Dentipellis fragilis TaxID=205917 RepID=A0A4Y9XL62_9AGAM|nr:hypothetical protein EVG20_g11509 [Dentipellis fragilis]